MPFIFMQYSPTKRSPLLEGGEGCVELKSVGLGVKELAIECQLGLAHGAVGSLDDGDGPKD